MISGAVAESSSTRSTYMNYGDIDWSDAAESSSNRSGYMYHDETDHGEFYAMKNLEKQWEREKDEKQEREEQMFTKDDDSGHYWD